MRESISLNGIWEFSERGSGNRRKGNVPGCVELDLLNLGEIRDPFYGMNEIDVRMLEEKEWIYRRIFDFCRGKAEYEFITLVFEGIDTTADIYMNGCFLGSVENMFIPHKFNIKSYIKYGSNTLEVMFHSAIRIARAREADSHLNLGYCCEKSFPYIRKAHYSTGWDWSPRLLTAGIWRPVYVELVEKAGLIDPYFATVKIEDGKAVVHLEVGVTANNGYNYKVESVISLNGAVMAQKQEKVGFIKGAPGVSFDLEVKDPELWWPNGYGKQTLYDIEFRLLDNGRIIDGLKFRSGIRTGGFLREKDSEGESFTFVINGVKIFCKGANWVPGDNFLPRFKRDDYRGYVKMARDANMNMLMVWGGGVYEDPAFYDACDEMGIMLWQNFMFHYFELPACSEWFRKLVSVEAETVVKKLRNHTSIVAWCGECESLWSFPSDDKYRGMYIYGELLPGICTQLDPYRTYRIASPYGGKDPNSMSEGDRHAWDCYIGWQDFDDFKKDTARFVSEFGVQSMPSWKTVQWYTPEDELDIFSPTVMAHNKFPDGDERLIRYMVGRLGFPKDLQSFVYLTQFNQAEALKLAIEHWRSRKFDTAGTLFWQFNDCWPCTSFSCIDYFKRKKALYYYIRNLYENILPVIQTGENGISISVISDELKDIDAEFRLTGYRMDGKKVFEKRFSAELMKNSYNRVREYTYKELDIGYTAVYRPVDSRYTNIVAEKNGEFLNMVIFIEAQVAGRKYYNYTVFDRFRNLKLCKPEVLVETQGNLIRVVSDIPVFGLFVETENEVDLSDNCMIMEPKKEYSIKCSAEPGDIKTYNLTDMTMPIKA